MKNPDSRSMFVSPEAKEGIRRRCEEFRARLPFPTEGVDLATSFGSTHITIAGPVDAPPMVALHGALASSAHLLTEMGSLAQTHRVYAVDVMGQSVWSEDRRLDVRDDSYARWLVEICDGLGLNEFDLFGVSWGGFIALQGARTMPDRIRHLVLMVPAGLVANGFWASLKTTGWPMMMYLKFPSPERRDRLMRAIFTTLDPHGTDYMAEAFQAYRLDMRIPPLAKPEQLRDVKCPVLVFAAEEDAMFPGAAMVKRVGELMPQAETELIMSSKHAPPMTDEFRSWMAARVEAFLVSANSGRP